MAQFVEEMCYRGDELSVEVSWFREEYEMWCEDQGVFPLTGRALAEELSALGAEVGRSAPRGSGGVRLYGGLALMSETDAAEPVGPPAPVGVSEPAEAPTPAPAAPAVGFAALVASAAADDARLDSAY